MINPAFLIKCDGCETATIVPGFPMPDGGIQIPSVPGWKVEVPSVLTPNAPTAPKHFCPNCQKEKP